MDRDWTGNPKEMMPGPRNAAGILVALAAGMISQRLLVSAIDFDGSSYHRNVSLGADLDIFWTIDTEAESVRLAVHATAATGWVGVGVSDMGGMEGADIVFYEAASGDITDSFSIVAGAPVADECTQDWALLSAEAGDGSLVFEAERALDSGDAQDRVFIDDTADGAVPTRLIAAWGDSETVSYHGAAWGKAEVLMFGGEETSILDPLLELKSAPGVSFVDVIARNFTIPEVRTHYESTCVQASELSGAEEFHIIGFEGVVQSDTAQYVHHLLLTAYYGVADCGVACFEWRNAVRAAVEVNSTDIPAMPPICSRMDFANIYAWAPNVDGVALPEEAGFLFGNATGGFVSVAVDIHYDNPNEVTGLVDNSGVRVYYTEELRPMDMGIITLGDPFLSLIGEPLPQGKSYVAFGCPSSCTEEHFEVESVTIFSHFLHTHENGQRVITRQYRADSRGNEELIHSAEVEYYSFLQAGGHYVYTDGTATIEKGDRFETECFYDTALSSVDSENVKWGFGSEDEMCFDFVAYYPNQNIPSSGSCGYLACGGALLHAAELDADSDFNRTFGTAAATCTTDDDEESSGELTASSSPIFARFALHAGAALLLTSMTLMLGTLLP
eukprot:g20787.t1